MWHSIGKRPIWAFLETEISRKIGEMVKKLPLCWQNTEKITPSFYSPLILHGNRGPIWSISIAAVCSEYKAIQKQVPHS